MDPTCTKESWIVNGDLSLSDCGVEVLPPEFGAIQTTGNVDLSGNILLTVPESFQCLDVGGNLNLSNNPDFGVEAVPVSFTQVSVTGNLSLDDESHYVQDNVAGNPPSSYPGNNAVHWPNVDGSVLEVTTLP
eukprot:TRINITY_DN911_c0_g1_i11.p1 TRINITY_DN911_c0_g1~~TRINITY_DN911_c0_g1_i11.p1  ORF type:complete len:132 (+),score=7.81 TRINITY_DN911_c0_g1_i11:301-696(+)